MKKGEGCLFNLLFNYLLTFFGVQELTFVWICKVSKDVIEIVRKMFSTVHI